MNDREFLDYCRTHAETPRCGFTPDQLARLSTLMGDHGIHMVEYWRADDRAVVECGRPGINYMIDVALANLTSKPVDPFDAVRAIVEAEKKAR